jgi:ribosomal protein S18 acetylase RimI-like enzyme
VIRQVDPRDPATAEALVDLQRASYAVEAALIGATVIPAMRERPSDLAASGLTFLAAVEDGAYVGAVAYRREGDTVDVHRLVVHPSAFRRGLATQLLDAVDARETGAARAVVASAAGNAPALALYHGRGFRPVRRRMVPEGIVIVEMERRSGS